MSAEAAPPRKKKSKLLILAVCIVFLAAGAAVPMVVPLGALKAEAKEKKPAKPVSVPFGEVVVNLSEERMSRYLKLKLAILTDADHEKDVTDKLTKQKAEVKSRIIAHIAGKTVKDVSGKVGVNRLQRELHDQFEDVLYPEGHSAVRNVLFEEYVVQ